MFVFVLNQHGSPLMPCTPAKARRLLKEAKAKVIRRTLFTIKLLYGSSGYKQPVVAGLDTDSKTLGCAAVANGQVVYQSEVTLRTDVEKKMQQRAVYRRNRRGRKTRYRKARFANRALMRKDGRLAPSVRSKLDSHLREKKQVESILPVTRWNVETAPFDIHKLTNYQQTTGRHSQVRLPTGKLFGLRKHDLVRTATYTGFVKGKRSTGFFALETIDGETLSPSVNVKKATTRLKARTTTLTQRKQALPPSTPSTILVGVSALQIG